MKRVNSCAFFVALGLGLSGHAFGQGITIGNYTLVSEKRVDRGTWEVVYTAQAVNKGFTAYGVTATVTSKSQRTIIVEGSLSFGDVYCQSRVTSSDTFTIRHNRAHSLDPEVLVWSVSSSAIVPITIATNPANLSFTVDGQTYNSSQTLSWVAGKGYTVATTSPQGSGGTRHVFAGWSDGGAISHGVTAPANAATYTANFTTQHQLVTAVSPASGGTIRSSPTSPDGYYDSGTSVRLTATVDTAYALIGWGGALTGSSNPQSVTLTSPLSVAAYFEPARAVAAVASEPVGAAEGRSTVAQTAPEDRVVLVRSIRHSSAAGYARVVIELDGYARYEEKRLGSPARLYFDLFETVFDPGASFKPVIVKDRFLRGIRAARNRAGIVRVVLDLAEGVECAVSTLPDPFRIVIDIRR